MPYRTQKKAIACCPTFPYSTTEHKLTSRLQHPKQIIQLLLFNTTSENSVAVLCLPEDLPSSPNCNCEKRTSRNLQQVVNRYEETKLGIAAYQRDFPEVWLAPNRHLPNRKSQANIPAFFKSGRITTRMHSNRLWEEPLSLKMSSQL